MKSLTHETCELKISHINVCGLKSKLYSPEFETFICSYDIVGISETKLCDEDIISFPGYEFFSKNRQNFIRKSGGIGYFVKTELLQYVEPIPIYSEYMIALRFKQSKHGSYNDIIIIFVYVPPEGSDYSNPDSILDLEQEILPLLDLCKHLYVMGDLNARCGTAAEFNDFDLSHVTADCYGIDDRTISFINNAHELCTNGIPMVRKSADKTKNNFGNKLLQLCRNNNLYICNGRICPDSSSDSTCIKGSVIDYLIANISGLVKINNFTVHEFTPILSDIHCAISFSVNIKMVKKPIEDVQVRYQKWESTKRLEFINNLDRNHVQTILTKLHSQNFDINTIVLYINNLFIKTAKNSFKKPIIVSTKVKRSKPWFGLQCRKAQKKYYTAKRLNHI